MVGEFSADSPENQKNKKCPIPSFPSAYGM